MSGRTQTLPPKRSCPFPYPSPYSPQFLKMRSPNPSLSRDQSPSRSDISSKTHKSFSGSVHSGRVDPTLAHKTSATRLRVTPRISASNLRSNNNNNSKQNTTSNNTIPASSYLQPTLASNSRTPLRNKDQNALSQTRAIPSTAAGTTKPKPKSISNMPPTHDNKGGNATPRQPVLSAKPLGRPPLTPKIASSKSQSSLHQQSQPNVTPLARRKTDNTTTTPSANDVSSPAVAATLMGNHITPRSGSRQTRVDSANSTPTGTPNPERIAEFEAESNKKHFVTFTQPMNSPAAANNRNNNDNPDSKFFYASDAKAGGPQQQHAQPTRPTMPQKSSGSTFMYANAMDRNRPTSPGISPGFTPMLAPAQESQASKFFYANGPPNLQPNVRPSSSASGTGSAVSASAKTTGPRISSNVPGGAPAGPGSRPMSPNKMPLAQSAAPSQVGKSQPFQAQTANRSSQVGSPPSLGPPPNGKRRVSIESGQQPPTHSRTGSVGSGDAMIMSKFMATQPAQPAAPGASQASSEASSPMAVPANPSMTMASIIQAAEDLPPESDESKGQSELQSPTKSHAGDPLNEAVANARRERKVQDLEIRNASLEAINRSLERQLRKQTAELRRYRRLSRSGRLSMASLGSGRIPSDSTVATSTTADGGVALSDLSEEDELFEDEEDDSMYDSDPSDAESLTSPGLKRTKRDEKRLQLDLSKHRELLVDSQKINQSIKRCLNWTEELISEGKKSLSYNVRVSDMELAPRVLAPQYDDDEDETAEIDITNGDMDTSNMTFSVDGEDEIKEALAGLGIDESKLAFLAPAEPPPEGATLTPSVDDKPPQERDSGVELTTDGGG